MGWLRDTFRLGGTGVAAPSTADSTSTRPKENEPGGSLQPWQKEAWGYYSVLGEIHYASGFLARMLSGVTLVVQELVATTVALDPTLPVGEPGTPVDADVEEWKDSRDPDLNGVLHDLENSRGGLGQLQGDYARLIFVQGESQLLCSLCDPKEQLGEVIVGPNGVAYVQHWEMLSAEELTYNKQEAVYTRKRQVGASKPERIPETNPDDPQPGTATAWRFYHRDPRFSGMADSSLRAVLDDCEELVLLKKSIRNMARNRGAGNGILCLPERMGGNEVDDSDGKKIPKNAKAIYDALTAPIANENSASAVTPVILFVPNGTTSSDVFHIDIRGAALYRETGLRDECIRRLAIGLDMPPEELTGVAGVNHWTAWQIDEAKWTSHGAPTMVELCGQLTAALLAPVARGSGKDPQKCRVWYDASAVVMDPDRARAAAEAFDRLAISESSYREATGWQEEDAPSEEEYTRRIEVSKAPKSAVEKPVTEAPAGQANVERIIGMADACLVRCRELAGSRLRTRMEKSDAAPNLRIRIKAVHNSDVAATLGADVRDTADCGGLVAGASTAFLMQLRRMQLDPGLCETLARRVEEMAARSLFEPNPALSDEVLAICGLISRRV